MSDKIRDAITDMLSESAASRPNGRPAIAPLTNGERKVLEQLRRNETIREALKLGRLDRHLLRGIMADILPLPITVVERLTGKFMGLLENGSLSSKTMEPSKRLIEGMGNAEDHASDADLDDIGMYGVGKGADMPEPSGDADDGVDQGEDHGDDSETADKGYMDEDEEDDDEEEKPDIGEDKDALPDHLHQKIFGKPKDSEEEAEGDDEEMPDTEPTEAGDDTVPELSTEPDQAKEGEGDQGPLDLDVEEDHEDDEEEPAPMSAEARAEAILKKWRKRYEKAAQREADGERSDDAPEPFEADEMPADMPPPKAEAYRRLLGRKKRLRAERASMGRTLRGVRESISKLAKVVRESKSPKARSQWRALKTERLALKSAIRRLKAESRRVKLECRKLLGPVTEQTNPFERTLRQVSEEIRTLRNSIRRLKEKRRVLKSKIREDDRSLSNETPDADSTAADYDKLDKVDGVSDYSKGGAKIEAEELKPEDPGDGSKGSKTIMPSDDTRDALETGGDETDPQNKAGAAMDLEAEDDDDETDFEFESEELKPEEPGDGSVGKASSPAKSAKIVKGVGQNEKRRQLRKK